MEKIAVCHKFPSACNHVSPPLKESRTEFSDCQAIWILTDVLKYCVEVMLGQHNLVVIITAEYYQIRIFIFPPPLIDDGRL